MTEVLKLWRMLIMTCVVNPLGCSSLLQTLCFLQGDDVWTIIGPMAGPSTMKDTIVRARVPWRLSPLRLILLPLPGLFFSVFVLHLPFRLTSLGTGPVTSMLNIQDFLPRLPVMLVGTPPP